MIFVCGEVGFFSLTHSVCMIFFSRVLLRGCVILCVERLREFGVWRGCGIFLTRSLRLHDLFFWRLHDFVCGEVA